MEPTVYPDFWVGGMVGRLNARNTRSVIRAKDHRDVSGHRLRRNFWQVKEKHWYPVGVVAAIASKSHDEIRAFVVTLEAARHANA